MPFTNFVITQEIHVCHPFVTVHGKVNQRHDVTGQIEHGFVVGFGKGWRGGIVFGHPFGDLVLIRRRGGPHVNARIRQKDGNFFETGSSGGSATLGRRGEGNDNQEGKKRTYDTSP